MSVEKGAKGFQVGAVPPWCLKTPASQSFTEGVRQCLYSQNSAVFVMQLCSYRAART